MVFGAAAVIACTGCSSTLVGSGPYTPKTVAKAADHGLRYYLAKDVVVVDATTTWIAKGEVQASNATGKWGLVVGKKVLSFVSADATVSTQTVPDTAEFYLLDLDPGKTSDDALTVETRPNGILKSVNVAVDDKSGEVLKSALQVAASAAAFAATADDPVPPDALLDQVAKEFEQKDQALVRPSLKGQTLETIFFLYESPDARALWLRRLKAAALAGKRAGERAGLEDKVGTEKTKDDVETLTRKLALIDDAFKRADDDRRNAVSAFDTLFQEFRRRKGITGEPFVRKVRTVFDLGEIPPPETLKHGMTPTEVGTTLGDPKHKDAYKKMIELFRQTGVALTLEPHPIWKDDPGNAEPKEAPVTSLGRFYFRQSYTGALSVYARASIPTIPKPEDTTSDPKAHDQLRLSDVMVLDLMPKDAPRLAVQFEPAAFASRKMGLSFDEKGRLMKLERSGTAALAAAAAATADGLAKARDEYAATLKKMQEIQDTRREIGLGELKTQLAVLQKKKDVVDAQVALAGADVTSDLLTEKKRLDAELGVLQTRLTMGSTQATADQQVEIAKLKATVDLLKQQLELLKTQVEIGKAKGGTSTTQD